MAVVEDFACTLCSCVCDDLRLTVENGRIVRAEKACVRAEPWLLGQDAVQPAVAQIEGRRAALDAALERAAELVAAARWPLIYGLSRSSTDGQRAAVRLADLIGATIDTTASRGHGPSIMAVQQAGESTCTLGEAKDRCDLVIFWGCNPAETHPRHLERYAADCAGLFAPRGREDRTIVVVDVEPTAESAVRPTVRFTTSVHGIHLPGTAYRMDEVPIPLRAALRARYPSDAEILEAIMRNWRGKFVRGHESSCR